MKKIKTWLKKVWSWLRENLLNKQMIWYTLIGEAIFWAQVWVPVLIALITGNSWWWGVSLTVIAFWAPPITPAIPLQIALILLIKKIHKKIGRKKDGTESKERP